MRIAPREAGGVRRIEAKRTRHHDQKFVGAVQLHADNESGRMPLGPLGENGTLTMTLPARGACLIEFVRPQD